ncbi:unnamed protein product [Triticum turgidum subsp. durum]|uniref:DUF4378 domain-containing protein n=1 Tax=Triticum turgidum subsp. durum TaxID=4567 RepID=A0A9R1NIV7_TRITD|nr:unnamed protein product [Triticum turgidum subsp. durum]
MGGLRRGGGTDGLHSHRRRRHHSPSHNAPPHLAAGVGSSSKQGGEPGMHSNSLFDGSRLCTPKRAGRTPMKMLIDDDVYRDVTARHTSPGVVGRLMGLDIMPSLGVHSKDTCNGDRSQGRSPGSYSDISGHCSDKYAFSGDVPRRASTDEIPEFKDVFEVMETTRTKNRNRNTCPGHDRVNCADLNFVRQKFMDAKRLSTDESFQRSKEFNGALEALVSNKDALMEILQESNNVAASDLSGLGCPPSSGVNRITLLKPSRRSKFIDADIVYPPEDDTERCFHSPKEAKHSPRKPHSNFSSEAPKEETGSLRQKLSRSSYRENIDKRISPTRIVVLKPCLDKNLNMEGAFPITNDMFCSSYRRTQACLDDGIQRQNAEESMPQISTAHSDARCQRAKGSREIAREVSAQMKTAAVRGGTNGKQKLSPDIGTSNRDEQVSLLTSMAKLKSSAALQRPSGPHDAPDGSCAGTSPTHSAKRSIRKEARRRLADRWKTTQQHQHPSQDGNATFSTLGDMLALSDKETSKFTSGAAASRQWPEGESHRDVIPGSCGYPLGISSNDGWKDDSICGLTRLESVSTSSINRGSPKSSSRKASCTHGEYSMAENIIGSGPYDSEDLHQDRPRRSLFRSSTYRSDESDVQSLDEVQSVVTEREIHVNFEEPTYTGAVPELSETGGRLVHGGNSGHLDSSRAVPEWQGEAQSSAQNMMLDQEHAFAADDHFIVPSPRYSASQIEGNGHDRCDDNEAPSDHLTELVSVVSSNEDEQPSPVSVLGSSVDAEDCCSGGFEKISADLQGLRMQLRLLKMEATGDADDDTDLALFSDDDETAASCELVNESAPTTSRAFRDEDERDLSYVADMLTFLASRSSEHDLLLGARYLSPGSPARGDAYDELERKYGELVLWARPERRLLFDLANDVLVEVVACWTQCGGQQGLAGRCRLGMEWGMERVVEEVWERVRRQRRETEGFQEEKLMGVAWLDCEDVTDEMVEDIGSMLGEDLLEEAIADLYLLDLFG